MTTNDHHDEIPSIVPERDELVQHRKQQRGSSQAARNAESAPGGTSGTVVIFITLLFLGMCATGGGAWFFYQQGELTKAALTSAGARIAALENTLSQMDESTRESAKGLLQRVDNNFKEVDKLWAARNALKVDIDKQAVVLTGVQKMTGEHDNALSNHGNLLSTHTNQLNTINTRTDQMSKNLAGMEGLGQQFATLNTEFGRIKTSQASIDKRLRDTEQDIESVNVFRQQSNQSIRELQAALNALQQKVGK